MNDNEFTNIRSIVLIDDDADFLHLVKRRLQAERAELATPGPVEIYTFTDAVEALVNLPAEGICVVLIDFSMPGGTGLDWLPKLLKAAAGPVILLTNNNDATSAADAFRAGASDYIAKMELLKDKDRLARAIRESAQRYRLERRNTLLTRQLKLVNSELEAKNIRLSELTETAHQFVDDVAHDFRTPLTVIQQYASLITDGLDGPVSKLQQNHLEVIAEATQDLSEMVDDFLDSSKLRSRSLSVYRRSHAAQELFDSIAPMLAVRSMSRQIAVDSSIAENTPPFFGDISKASRVLTNLVVNALKLTPQGGELKLWARSDPTGDVRVGVTDQGPGLNEKDLQIIFNRFQQLDEPQLANVKGFGLGLSIVKQLSWLNLGEVNVQSEPGKGSTFSFTLPAYNLKRILSCYLQHIQLPEEKGDFHLLRINTREPEGKPSILYRLVSTFCYPTDLVLQDKDSLAVTALGISRDANRWARRLREMMGNFSRSTGDDPIEVEINAEGPWVRSDDTAKIFDVLFECLNNGSCHV